MQQISNENIAKDYDLKTMLHNVDRNTLVTFDQKQKSTPHSGKDIPSMGESHHKINEDG